MPNVLSVRSGMLSQEVLLSCKLFLGDTKKPEAGNLAAGVMGTVKPYAV